MAPLADCFGVMCYLHTHRTSRSLQHCRSFIRALTEVALRHHGRPYLTYAWAQTDEQLRQAYPQLPTHVRDRGRPGAPTSDFAERVDDAWVGATRAGVR